MQHMALDCSVTECFREVTVFTTGALVIRSLPFTLDGVGIVLLSSVDLSMI